MGIETALIGGGALLGGALISADAAGDAAETQADAANRAAGLTQGQFNQTQENLSPWMRSGRVSLAEMNRLLGLPSAELPVGRGPVIPEDGSTIGSNISRDQFDAGAYLRQNPDVANARVDPWGHYQEYGRFENRRLGITPEQIAAINGVQSGTVRPETNLPTGFFTRQFTLKDFQESPAYQFNLQQGQKAIENAASKNKTLYAPATLQNIGRYSQGLASNEFQNAMGNFYGFQDRLFNRLFGLSGSGQNAAANLGGFGMGAASQTGDALMSGAAASAAGRVGSANAFNNAIGQGLNAWNINQILQNSQRSSVGGGGVSLAQLPEIDT